MRSLHISSKVRWESDYIVNKYSDVFKGSVSIHYVLHSLIEDILDCTEYVAGDVIYRLRTMTPNKDLFDDYLIAGIVLYYSKIVIDRDSNLFRLDFLMDNIFRYYNGNDYMEKIIKAMSHPDTAYIGRNLNMTAVRCHLSSFLKDRDVDEGQFLLLELYCGRMI